jgi:pimeloyl-ACP methyl ester carboxylesterase
VDTYPLVLLPGMNCSAALLDHLGLDGRTALTRVLAETSLQHQVDRLLRELPPRFSLAGLSLGGIVAMALARCAPERVAGLCLLSTNPRAPTNRQLATWSDQQAALAAGLSARDLQHALLPQLLSPATLTSRPDLVQTTLAMADEVGTAALSAQLRLQATRVDERPGLKSIRCPTLIIAAADDALCPVARHQELSRLIPDSRLIVVQSCAHLSPLEQPEVVGQAIREWQRDLRRRPRRTLPAGQSRTLGQRG